MLSLAALLGGGSAGANTAQTPPDVDPAVVVAAHDAAFQARRDSLAALDPTLPAVAATHSAVALEWWVSDVEAARDYDPADAFVFLPPFRTEVLTVGLEEIDGTELAFMGVCQLEAGEQRSGYSFEPSPSDDPADYNTRFETHLMTPVDGTWRLAGIISTPSDLGTLGCMAD